MCNARKMNQKREYVFTCPLCNTSHDNDGNYFQLNYVEYYYCPVNNCFFMDNDPSGDIPKETILILEDMRRNN